MHNDQEPHDVGSGLAAEAVASVTDRAEEYCRHECQRIALANEPRINVLQAEGRELAERAAILEKRLRTMPPPGDSATRKRRARSYLTVGLLLTLAAFAFTLIGFGPYKLGSIGVLYCLGIAAVTPFAVDEFLKAWNAESILKAGVAVIFGAAVLGGVLLATIRGDLLTRKVAQAAPAVVIEDAGAPATEPKESFYESTEVALQILMLCFALAIDLGAGIAFHRARAERAALQDDPGPIEWELAAVRQRIGEVVHEFTALRNAPAAFAARFWRDFYRAMVTETTRKAITKGLGVVILVAALSLGRAVAEDRVNVVVALDLSVSEGAKGADEKTPFERNVAGITRLLGAAPAGARVTIVGITEDSIADPYSLLTADLSADVGYFGDRLAAARAAVVRAWRARIARLAPSAGGTDLIGVMHLASELFQREPRGQRNVLVVFSDMRNATPTLNLENPNWGHVGAVLKALEVQGQVANLAGVTIYVVGANGGGRSVREWQAIKDFWLAYFAKAGARCAGYSILATPPLLER